MRAAVEKQLRQKVRGLQQRQQGAAAHFAARVL